MAKAVVAVDNRSVLVDGAPVRAAKAVSRLTSYLQDGYQHSKAYQGRWWDGRRRLASMLKDGRLKAPAGLAQEVVDILEGHGVEVEVDDRRRVPGYSLGLKLDERVLRPYQRTAVDAATSPIGSLRLVGRGIVKMPPRSGKTVVAAAVAARLDVRTLFVVPSKSLLYQARAALEKWLGVEVGMAGDTVWEPRDVTVATIQTLWSRRGKNTKAEPASPEYLELIRRSDLVVFDEVHHLEADKWRKVMQDSGAAYKVGLSATVFLDHERECELGVIWLRACTGEVLVDVSLSDLIEQGYLVRPDVRLYPVRTPDLRKRGWSKRMHGEAIYRNAHRNRMVVDATRGLVADGMRVVVITNRLEQVGEITRMLNDTTVRFARVTGQTQQRARERHVKRFQRGELRVLVSTVMDEGVDIPEIDAVVVAEGGSDIKKTYQRLRCLTPCNGKDRAVVVDFVDLMHPYFAEHSLKRLEVYRGERAFRVSVHR